MKISIPKPIGVIICQAFTRLFRIEIFFITIVFHRFVCIFSWSFLHPDEMGKEGLSHFTDRINTLSPLGCLSRGHLTLMWQKTWTLLKLGQKTISSQTLNNMAALWESRESLLKPFSKSEFIFILHSLYTFKTAHMPHKMWYLTKHIWESRSSKWKENV